MRIEKSLSKYWRIIGLFGQQDYLVTEQELRELFHLIKTALVYEDAKQVEKKDSCV
jgi:hypothetical protein